MKNIKKQIKSYKRQQKQQKPSKQHLSYEKAQKALKSLKKTKKRLNRSLSSWFAVPNWDGELFAHQVSRADIVTLCKKTKYYIAEGQTCITTCSNSIKAKTRTVSSSSSSGGNSSRSSSKSKAIVIVVAAIVKVAVVVVVVVLASIRTTNNTTNDSNRDYCYGNCSTTNTRTNRTSGNLSSSGSVSSSR